MPVPTAFSDLSTTAASNSPAASDNVFPDLDEHLRALAAFIASIYANSGNGWTSPYLPNASAAVFNEAGADLDFRAEGDTDTNLLFLDAGNDRVGIGTGSPASKLHTTGTLTISSGGEITAIDQALGTLDFRSDDVSSGSTGPFGRISVHNEFNGSWDGTAARLDTYMKFMVSEDGTLAEAARFNSAGDWVPILNTSAPTLSTNNQMVFTLTSDTNLRISVRGSDGTTRVANITLA